MTTTALPNASLYIANQTLDLRRREPSDAIKVKASIQDGISHYLENLLQQLIDHISKCKLGPVVKDKLKNFECSAIPQVSFSFFVKRFVLVGNIDDEVLTYSFVYIKNLIRKGCIRDPKTLHKLFATSVFVAYKYLNEDSVWFLEDFAKLSGITASELFKQEISFTLNLMEGNCFVCDETYSRARKLLLSYSENSC